MMGKIPVLAPQGFHSHGIFGLVALRFTIKVNLGVRFTMKTSQVTQRDSEHENRIERLRELNQKGILNRSGGGSVVVDLNNKNAQELLVGKARSFFASQKKIAK